MSQWRICFVGDSITNGTLDEAYQGWPGRLCAAAAGAGHDVTLYNLGVRAETTALIRRRWRAECEPRIPEPFAGALVFAFGVNDMAEMADGTIRVPIEASVENARAIIAAAQVWKPVLWVGPAPADADRNPFSPQPGISYSFHNGRTRELSERYAALAADLAVPYLPVFDTLERDPVWQRALREGDGIHPTGEGYARIADLVGDWESWRAWFV